MKASILIVCATFASCGFAATADTGIRAGENQIVGQELETDTTFKESISVAPWGSLVKLGAGTWTLPYSSIWQCNAFNLNVLGGKINFTFDNAGQNITATSVLQNAELWLDASKNVATRESGKLCWNDCRESQDAAVYSYPGAISGNVKNNPVPTDCNGRKMMFFNGAESGSWMYFETAERPGTPLHYTDVKHIFLVADFDTCYTYVLGGKWAHHFMIGSDLDSTSINQTYWSKGGANSEAIYKAATYVNGTRIDGTTTVVGRGLRIIEIAFPDLSPTFFSFFNETDTPRYMGGDYLGEAIFFKRALTDEERLDINSYLAQKWFGTSHPESVSLSLAQGTEASVSVDDAEVKSVGVRGEGLLTKTGGGTLEINPDTALCRSGTLHIKEGMVKTVNPSVNYSFLSGENVAVEADSKNGLTLKSVAGESGSILKTGSGELRIDALPHDACELTVAAGELTLVGKSAVNTLAPAVKMEAIIPNASFEEFAKSGASDRKFNNNETVHGWTFGDTGNAWFVCPSKLPADSWMIGSQPYAPYAAPDGEVVLILNGKTVISTTVTFPQQGAYELTFKTTTRDGSKANNSSAFEGMPYDIQLIRDDNVMTVAHFRAFRNNGFKLNRFLIPHVETGDYTLRIAAAESDDRKLPVDGCTNFDDFRMTFAGDKCEASIPVPNGDFETTDFLYSNYESFTAEPSPKGWTLVQGGIGGEGGMPDVGALCYGFNRHWNSGSAKYGNTVLFFCSNGGEAVSGVFHVPAGRYHLRFRGGRWGTGSDWKWHDHCLMAVPAVSGSVSVAGEKTTLAALEVGNNVYCQYEFPETIEVKSGTDDIVVSLNQTVEDAGLHLDEVCFVPERELVRNGGFEKDESWEFEKPEGSNANAQYYDYSWGQQWFGYSRHEGKRYLLLTGLGRARQEIYFPEVGCYRVSFRVCARYDSAQYRNNQMRLYVKKDGIEKEIAKTRKVSATEFGAYTYLFRIDEPGTYEFGMEGIVNADKTLRVDGVGIERVHEAETPDISRSTSLAVENGAKLRLDFTGTLQLRQLKLGGHSVSGIVDASRFPEFLSGPGALFSRPLMVIVK